MGSVPPHLFAKRERRPNGRLFNYVWCPRNPPTYTSVAQGSGVLVTEGRKFSIGNSGGIRRPEFGGIGRLLNVILSSWKSDPRARPTVAIAGASHLPPDALRVPDYMEELVAFINHDDPPKYDLLKAALAHHRFAWIHPFSNGNGRVVRRASSGASSGDSILNCPKFPKNSKDTLLISSTTETPHTPAD